MTASFQVITRSGNGWRKLNQTYQYPNTQMVSDMILCCHIRVDRYQNLNSPKCIDQSDLHTCLKLIISGILNINISSCSTAIIFQGLSCLICCVCLLGLSAWFLQQVCIPARGYSCDFYGSVYRYHSAFEH